jgi:hypothetical protein
MLSLIVTPNRPATAQDANANLISREHSLKALFLYNFAGYVEWPAETFANEKSPFVIGILGTSQVQDTLAKIAESKKIGDRPIVIRNFAEPKDIKDCQIIFVPSTIADLQQKEVLNLVRNSRILVVGETSGYSAKGAAMNFYMEDNKIRFEVNTEAAKRQQLKVSSKLLSMAKIVQDASGDQAKK